ncbi:hypothetical protein PENTCL1PPCAC_929, partial [Pristionchus entomophagus]
GSSSSIMNLEWLLAALEEKFGLKPTIGECGPISEASHGYMAQIRRVQLEWPIQREDLPGTVVVKCPVDGSAADAWRKASGGELAMDKMTAHQKRVQDMCHAHESQIYALFNENYPAPCPIPKAYAVFGLDHEHPAIVMEDITEATITDIVDGWTEKQLYTIIDSLVDIHVMSFTTEKWKSFEYKKDEVRMTTMTNNVNRFATQILKERGPLSCLEKVQANLLQNGDWFIGMYDKYEHHPESVLVHGDMWAPQFLWRGDTLAAIVDWQLTHHGSVMEDFLRLLSLGVSPSIRARLTPTLLHYYYTQLSYNLAEKGAEIPFLFCELEEEYKASLPYAAGMAVFAFSMWSNSPVLKSVNSDDDDRIAEIFSRMTSILEECVEAFGW